jgi:serine/threonine protein kinase
MPTYTRLFELLRRWHDLQKANVPTTPEELCREDPGLLEEFRKLIGGQETPLRDLANISTKPHEAKALTKSTADLWMGQTGGVPGYDIIGLLGRGGMGIVYHAWQTKLNRPVALKMIRHGDLASPEDLERFRNEAHAVAHLHHPNIIQIYEIGEHNGLPFFTMEFIEGGSLEQFKNKRLPLPLAAEMVQTLALAMHHSHQRGIVHRDLKPNNVLRTLDGLLKITDFGLAKRLDSRSNELTGSGAILGSASYMAPEQAKGQTKEAGPAADIYALGAILYELITGRAPFKGATALETLEMVRTQEPVRPSQVRADIPSNLEAICLKCLEKEPGRRYLDAGKLADDLGRFLAGEDVEAQALADWERVAHWARGAGYEVLGELGRGQMGIVYRARDVGLDRSVALKVFDRGDNFARPEMLDQFRDASRAVAKLQHPNVLQIYACGEQRQRLFVAEELVDGKRLDEVLGSRPQDPRAAARLVEELAKALHYVHQRGLVHRNLKPRAILLVNAPAEDEQPADDSDVPSARRLPSTPYGTPKVTSFELAKLPSQQAAPDADRDILGTPSYMAPEQTPGSAQAIGPTADVYSLGVILYEMLTGALPFLGRTKIETFEQIQNREPAPLSQARPGVSPDLEAICLKCLCKDAERRYASARQLAEDLRRFLNSEQVRARPRPAALRILRWVRQRPWATTIVVLFALAMIFGIWEVASYMMRTMTREP